MECCPALMRLLHLPAWPPASCTLRVQTSQWASMLQPLDLGAKQHCWRACHRPGYLMAGALPLAAARARGDTSCRWQKLHVVLHILKPLCRLAYPRTGLSKLVIAVAGEAQA